MTKNMQNHHHIYPSTPGGPLLKICGLKRRMLWATVANGGPPQGPHTHTHRHRCTYAHTHAPTHTNAQSCKIYAQRYLQQNVGSVSETRQAVSGQKRHSWSIRSRSRSSLTLTHCKKRSSLCIYWLLEWLIDLIYLSDIIHNLHQMFQPIWGRGHCSLRSVGHSQNIARVIRGGMITISCWSSDQIQL